MDSHTFELRVASVADPRGLQEMQGATAGLAQGTEAVGTAAAKTKADLEGVTKAATEAHAAVKRVNEEASLTHENKTFKEAVRDVRQTRRAEGAMEGFMRQGPEQLATMGVVRFIESITEKAGPAIAAIAGIGLAFETGKKLMETWMERVPHLKEETEQLGEAIKDTLGNALEGVFGEGSSVLKGVQWFTRLLGGQTEEMKRLNGPMKDYVGIAENSRDATERWAHELAAITAKFALAKAALADLAAEQKLLNELEMSDADYAHAQALEEINNNEALSAEEKAVRIIAAEKSIADAKAAFSAQERQDALEKARAEQQLGEHELQVKNAAFEEQKKLVNTHNAFLRAQKERDFQEQQVQREDERMKGRAGIALGTDANGFMTHVEDSDYVRDKARQELEKEKLEAAEKRLKDARELLPKGVTWNEGKEKDSLESRRKAAEEALKKADAEKEHAESLERQNETATERESRARKERDRVAQTKTDQATGTGNSPGALDGSGFNRPSIDEQAAIDAAKKGEKPGKSASGAGPSGGAGGEGSGVGSGGGGVSEGPVLRQIEINTRGGGGGGSGGGSGGSGGGGSPSGPPRPSSPSKSSAAAAPGPSSFDDFTAARKAFDEGVDTPGADLTDLSKGMKAAGNAAVVNSDGSYKSPSQVAEDARAAAHDDAEKAAAAAKREGELEMDDRIFGTHTAHPADPAAAAPQGTSKQAPEGGGKSGHSNSAVTGHGQSPHETGRAMGEAAAPGIATAVHKAITEGDKAKMAEIAKKDYDAEKQGHPRVVGMQSDDPNQNTGKGAFAAGGQGGNMGYNMHSAPPPEPDHNAGDRDPATPKPQQHELPPGMQFATPADTSGFAALQGMVVHMGAMAGHVGDLVGHSRQAAKAFETSTHRDQFVTRINDPYAQ